ncbi:MAG TPA: dihydropteroate synthase [Gemmataceae bacterium]
MRTLVWQCGRHRFEIRERALVLGIVNVTPDSFSDGGRFFAPGAALAHARRLIAAGADLLDVGGESSRPGAQPVPAGEELRRVLPLVTALAAESAVPVSVDTTKAAVARRCLEAGAAVVNDITGLRGDPEMPAAAREFGAGVIVMHMKGTPATMQQDPTYEDVVAEVGAFFQERIDALTSAGLAAEQIALDPGIGFGKTREHNLQLLANLGAFRRFGRPLCLGVSRKRFLGDVLGRAVGEREAGSLAAVCHGMARGWVQIARVHDVAPARDAAVLYAAIAGHERP